MRTLYALLTLLLLVTPASAQRVCQQVGQSIQCSDGSAASPAGPGTYHQSVPAKPGARPPKDGTFEYLPNGTVCQVFGKTRYCK